MRIKRPQKQSILRCLRKYVSLQVDLPRFLPAWKPTFCEFALDPAVCGPIGLHFPSFCRLIGRHLPIARQPPQCLSRANPGSPATGLRRRGGKSQGLDFETWDRPPPCSPLSVENLRKMRAKRGQKHVKNAYFCCVSLKSAHFHADFHVFMPTCSVTFSRIVIQTGSSSACRQTNLWACRQTSSTSN
jgi:hypothetical protein